MVISKKSPNPKSNLITREKIKNRRPRSSVKRNIAQNFSHVPGPPMRYISNKPRRIGLCSFMRKKWPANRPAEVSSVAPYREKGVAKEVYDRRQPSCHHLNFQDPITHHTGRTLPQTKAPTL
ncbi:hypothetical protein PoB_000011700 [Plakobranchus ocellatus]|uniref:Uncharacterized protein n=1 Tax=Plakobranchus ocellatus TaxID=259542 RepID=A0AAV3XUS9_9GAST|nr:hypothetical protein PoB_000011700 [Plakobranchus ocellatus]